MAGSSRPQSLPKMSEEDSRDSIRSKTCSEEAPLLNESRSDVMAVKTLTYWDGLSLVVTQQIGSGIFRAPAMINKNAGSPGMSLILWVLAGCIAWSGSCGSPWRLLIL